jgi:hypothetical protein
MKRICLFVALSCSALFCGPAFALDRDASFIHSLEAYYREYDQFEAVGALVRSEAQIPSAFDFGLLLHLGWGSASTDAGTKNLWLAGLGVREELTAKSAVNLGTEFTWVDSASALAVVGAKVGLDFRLSPADSPVSPFVNISAACHTGRSTPWTLPYHRFTAAVLTLDGGCDFALQDDLALVVRAQVTQSLGFSGGPYADYANGWATSLGMKYYWH